MPRIVRAAGLVAGALWVGGCSVFGVRTGLEQPPYEVVDQVGETLEVRRYQPRLVAQVTLDADDPAANDNAAFRILADYIFGANTAAESMDMTAPVTVAKGERMAMTAPVETVSAASGRYAMRFYLPATYSVASAPAPLDPRVEIIEVPSATVGVVRFSGTRRPERVERRKSELMAQVDASAWRPIGAPVALYYDPPWTLPFLRRNEVGVEVAPR